MHGHDAAPIRQPLLSGHQHIDGLWFAAERFSAQTRGQLLLRYWQTGASAWRFAEGDLLQFAAPWAVQCESQLGWPLLRQGRGLCSAPLTAQEQHDLPTADLWLVLGSQVRALYLVDAQRLEPGQWLDISDYGLLDTYDCRDTLLQPAFEPLAVSGDARDILGDVLGPASAERDAVMQALRERHTAAVQRASRPVLPRSRRTAELPHPWRNGGVALLLCWALFCVALMAGAPPSAATGVSVLVLTIIAWRSWCAWRSELQGSAETHAEMTHAPALHARASAGQRPGAPWRRWLSRMLEYSRLSRVYGKRQAAYMQRMLAMFESGELNEALRHAIPLGDSQGEGEQTFGTPRRRDALNISQRVGAARSMFFDDDLQSHLRHIYRRSFERLDREGRIEEAVFVLAELLKVRQEALDYLELHQRYRQAADFALGWDMPAALIVRLLVKADDWPRALLVARRDDAFAEAVAMLHDEWPAQAARLRLEWALTLVGKGLWLKALEVIWSLPGERKRAMQWLLAAEAAGGQLGVGALVKRAIMLPDTLGESQARIEQLCHERQYVAERAGLARELLQNKAHGQVLGWLTRMTLPAILADQADGPGQLSDNELQALIKMSGDKLLQADLPGKLPPRLAASLESLHPAQDWQAPQAGNLAIHDAQVLPDERYLLALGEAGTVVIDANGKRLFHFVQPAQALVIAHSGLVALALVRREQVWRVSRLDLVKRTADDLGVLMFDVFARSFDGTGWTIGQAGQLRVVDVEHGFACLWQVSDLPGRIQALQSDTQGESLWLVEPSGARQLWRYVLPGRRLARREPMAALADEHRWQVFSARGEVLELRLERQRDEDPILVCESQGERRDHCLPGVLEACQAQGDVVQVQVFEQWLVIGYLIAGHARCWHFIHRGSDRCCLRLQWPQSQVQLRCVQGHWLLFDDQGRLSHINIDQARQRNLSIN